MKNKSKNTDNDDEEGDTTFGAKLKRPSAQPTAKAQEISFEVLEKKKRQ